MPNKKHTLLLDIFSEIHTQKPDLVLLLVRDGSLQGEIEDKTEKLNLRDSVILLGIQSDAADLFQAMDITSASVVLQSAKVAYVLEYVSLEESPEYWAEKLL